MSDIAQQNETIAVQINFFGAFRKFGDSMTLDVAPGSTADDVKEELITRLGEDQRNLVADSVLADDEQILGGETEIAGARTLSILPPVCGG